ncbi:MAG: hypothetical protein Q8N00_00415 [Nitrospirota bacterium]|nr:hypothetical protein [Nitrospirota bacterium]MDP3598609.1 hypothetical protein [Nitrospirota bacterium]
MTRLRLLACTLVLLLSPGLAYSQSQTQKTSSVDGAHTTTGARANTAVTDSTTTNSLMSFLKGLVKIFADVWDDPNNRLNVAIQNTPTVTTQQSNVTVDADTGGGTQTLTLFGIALPASGGSVIGGTSTNPFVVSGTINAAQSGTWTMQPGNTANTTPWLFSISQGGNTAAVNASSQLSVNCANCSGSGVSQQDNTGFTAGTTNMVPLAGFVGSTAVTSGNAGAVQMTADRMLFTNLGKVGGTAIALGQTNMSASLPVTLASNQSTLPVSLASVPSHAVTNVGTFATQESGAALTALQLIDNLVATIGSTTSGQSGALSMGAVTTAAPSYTTAQTNPLSLTPSGELRVRMESTAVGSTSTDDDNALPSGTTAMSEVIDRMYAYNSDSASTVYTRWSHQPLDFDSGAGTENLSVIGIGLPASGGPVIGGTSSNPFNVVFPSAQSVTLPADPFGANADAASATGSISAKLRFMASTGIPITGTVTVGSHAVTNVGTFATQAAQSGTWTMQPGNTANTTPWLVSLVPPTSGGTTPCYITSAATTNATNCKASAGQLYGYELINTTGTLYYLRLYNLASAPTCSSATGFIRSIPIPAATTGAGVTRSLANGEAYGTGIGFCLTAGGASTDNTNAATGVYVSLNYK